jgi:hypothetical protein
LGGRRRLVRLRHLLACSGALTAPPLCLATIEFIGNVVVRLRPSRLGFGAVAGLGRAAG